MSANDVIGIFRNDLLFWLLQALKYFIKICCGYIAANVLKILNFSSEFLPLFIDMDEPIGNIFYVNNVNVIT